MNKLKFLNLIGIGFGFIWVEIRKIRIEWELLIENGDGENDEGDGGEVVLEV